MSNPYDQVTFKNIQMVFSSDFPVFFFKIRSKFLFKDAACVPSLKEIVGNLCLACLRNSFILSNSNFEKKQKGNLQFLFLGY